MPLEHKLTGVANALSASPEGNAVIVAGRDVLQILQVNADDIVMTHNLRTGRVNLNYSSNDVKWCPIVANKQTIVTAATNGAIGIWDVSSSNKQLRVIAEHPRAVNRVCFHPTNAFQLLSASIDGTVRMWDTRESASSATFQGKAESARDVQFCPSEPFAFAAVFETGVVQKWDVRMPDRLEKRITAHSGPIYTLDWHPEGRYLVSGSRDKTIKVWDMKQSDTRRALVQTIQTISSVGHLQWRPGHRNQFASVALLQDRRIQVWDLKNKYVPELTIDEHTDVSLGILWRGADTLWSCSKDQTFMQHAVGDGYQESKLNSHSAVAFSPFGDLAFATPLPASTSALATTTAAAKPKKAGTTTAAAAAAATTIGAASTASSTLIIVPVTPEQVFGLTTVSEEQFDHESFIYFAQNYQLDGDTPANLCAHNARIVEQHQPFSVLAQTWKILQLLCEESDEDGMAGVAGAAGAEATSLEVPEPAEPKPTTLLPPLEEEEDDDEAEFLQPVPSMQSLRSLSSRSSASASASASISASAAAIVAATAATVSQTVAPEFAPVVFDEWHEKPVLMQTLEYYAEMADVQTCVSVLIVLLHGTLDVSDAKIRLWFSSYIELLQRFKLWSVAALITAKCPSIEVRVTTQASTTVNTSCNACFTKLLQQDDGYWLCASCKKATGPCAICRVAVKGLYLWCEGCGHGGHTQHLLNWFSEYAVCPAGCGHVCTAMAAAAAAAAASASPATSPAALAASAGQQQQSPTASPRSSGGDKPAAVGGLLRRISTMKGSE